MNGDRISGRTYGTNQYLDDFIRRGKPKGGGDPGGPGGSEFGRGAAKKRQQIAPLHTDLICFRRTALQLCKDAVEGGASTAGRGERYPGELGDRWAFRWRFGLCLGGRRWHQGFCFRFHGCGGGWSRVEESSSRHAGLGVCRVRACATNIYRVRVQVRYEKLEARGDCRSSMRRSNERATLADKRFGTIYE